ncbi:MAG: aquaporin [Anaerolineae bacterium]|nr:MAG: MIP family channel protein [Chloroflexi bacterium OLB13]MBW7880431.1 aquaporin [Anaerolineae bacterium]
MNRSDFKAFLAELLGTFTLVFIGAAAVIVAPQFGVAVPAFAHGLALVGIVFVYGPFSGAHVNPAVTLGVFVAGRISASKMIQYWVAQFIGGIIGGVLAVALMNTGAADFNYGQTLGSIDPLDFRVMAIEAVLTFFLVAAVLQTAVFGRGGALAPLAIGLTLTFAIFAGGAFTGASLNPARTIGSALAAGDLSYILPYIIGPSVGGAVAALVNAFLLGPDGEGQ